MKVAILLSTYNGEKYLADQIKSIQRQTFKKWDLYVRDDGSTDNTVDQIKEYSLKDNRIHFLSDNCKNMGPMRSFLKLLKEVEADYYFFCDQDDVWLEDKLLCMLKPMVAASNDKPRLVYCGLKCVDQNLNSINNDFENLMGSISGKARFIGNDMPGCVMLFNKLTRNIAVKYTHDYNDIIMHDWWIALIAETFGQIDFINQKFVLYRQHGDNSIGAGKNGGIIRKIFQKGILKKQKDIVRQTYLQDYKFYSFFKDILPTETRIFLSQLIDSKNKNILFRFKLFHKNKFNSYSVVRTCVYEYFFIFHLKSILNN